MERILRSKEMAEIVLLPIRHHSPACALHVQQMIQRLHPCAILVEGPDNANSLLPVIVHEEMEAPFAIYYSCHDEQGLISEGKEHYRCYYPFLDYSPELVALREGKRLGIQTAFIDLPYGDILAASEEGRGLLKKEEEKSSYNDDYLLSKNEYLAKLCNKTGLRSFEEFWEKYFELNGRYEDGEKWFSALLTYCRLARENTSEQSLEEDGCLARERHMAGRIMEYAKDAAVFEGTVLVITGGFHTPALKALLKGEVPWEDGAVRIPQNWQGVYLMPYSMEAADALNGYASGMPFAGFYQKAWERMQEETPYGEAVLDMIVASGKETRKKEGYLSTYDEICACAMAKGLAELRGKREAGAYELLDAVLSSFVKGEYNLASDTPMRLLKKHMTGGKAGKLCKDADVPPILNDFEETCKKLGIKAGAPTESEVILSVFANKKHRQISMFLNRMAFLGTAFAKKVKGPDLQHGKDKNLMREVWKYKWSAQVNAALIDVSVYGATVEEAAKGVVKAQLGKELGAREGVLLLTHAFEMGLSGQLQPVYDRVYGLLLADSDFYSVAGALKSLRMMEELGALYSSQMEFGALVHMAGRKLIALLPFMTRIKEEDFLQCMEALKLLYQLTGQGRGHGGVQEEFGQEREAYYDALEKMRQDRDIHAGLNGCIYGILYGSGRQTAKEAEAACQSYLMGTKEQRLKTAQFFRGLFSTARDLVFIGEDFLKRLDAFFSQAPKEEFMQLLPELRMAFAYFTPREIDKLAAMAAGFHGKQKRDISEREEVLPDWYSYGKEIDGYVKEKMGYGRR